MNTEAKKSGQVKRLVLEIDGTKIVLDASVTKEEALSLVDILAKGAKRLDSHYASAAGSYQEVAYAEKDVDVALRVTGSVIMASVTKEEALSLVDILAKGAKRLDSNYASAAGSYQEVAYAEKDVDVALRVTGSVIMDTRSAAQASADAASAAAAAAAKEVAK